MSSETHNLELSSFIFWLHRTLGNMILWYFHFCFLNSSVSSPPEYSFVLGTSPGTPLRNYNTERLLRWVFSVLFDVFCLCSCFCYCHHHFLDTFSFGCMMKHISVVMERIVPFCSTMGCPHLESHVQFWAPQYRKNIKLLCGGVF